MKNHDSQKAIIYRRTATKKQPWENSSLDVQEARCRQYAKQQGYKVTHIFGEEGISGLQINPGMQNMLKFLQSHKTDKYVVIVDHISRLSRNVATHVRLRKAIHEAGGGLESPSFDLSNTPEGHLIEQMMVSREELEEGL